MLTFENLTGKALLDCLADLARLRIEVFAEWPYLYDGSLAYEERYLEAFAASKGAVIIAARDPAGHLVGAATAAPLRDHAKEFAEPFAGAGLDPAACFYLAESVLRKEWRGHGAGRTFFRAREAEARRQGFGACVFASVMRPEDHPSRPQDYQPLDPFWRRLGYRPVDGLIAHFSWKDLEEEAETDKPLQVWHRTL